MNHQQGIKIPANRRIVVTLLALMFFAIACQNCEKGPDVKATNANETAEAKHALDLGNTNRQPEENKATEPPTKCVAQGGKPSIAIAEVPSKGGGPDEMEPIAGGVSGVNASECKVVIFAHTDTWWVQPYAASPDTDIGDDCKWKNDTHLGSEYAALLVKKSYKPPSTTGILPNVGGLVLALTKVPAKD